MLSFSPTCDVALGPPSVGPGADTYGTSLFVGSANAGSLGAFSPSKKHGLSASSLFQVLVGHVVSFPLGQSPQFIPRAPFLRLHGGGLFIEARVDLVAILLC